MKKKNLSFEDGLIRLEEIAQQMESNDLPLEEMLGIYEEGTKLSAELMKKLEDARGRMLEVKQGKDGKPSVSHTELVEQGSMLDQMGGE